MLWVGDPVVGWATMLGAEAWAEFVIQVVVTFISAAFVAALAFAKLWVRNVGVEVRGRFAALNVWEALTIEVLWVNIAHFSKDVAIGSTCRAAVIFRIARARLVSRPQLTCAADVHSKFSSAELVFTRVFTTAFQVWFACAVWIHKLGCFVIVTAVSFRVARTM